MDRIRSIVKKAKGTAKAGKENCAKKARYLDELIADLCEQRDQSLNAKREFELISRLGGKGSGEAWRQLPKQRKYEKEVLLAVFCGNDIPPQINESNWASNAPEDLNNDRDILIARASATKDDDRWQQSPYFSIPEALLGDLDVLRAVAKPSPRALLHSDIPMTMFDDVQLFQAFVDRYELPSIDRNFGKSLEVVLGKFNRGIRSNAQFMLQAATLGLNVFPYIAGELRRDKDFCLKLAKASRIELDRMIPDNALTYFSDALRNDFDIVCAFLEKNIGVLMYCSELDKARVSREKDLVTRIYDGNRLSPLPFANLYAILDDDLKRDFEIVVAARKVNCFDVADLPKELFQDPNFWKYALEKCSFFWEDLPDAFKHDISFARCITGFYSAGMVKDVVAVHPELSLDAEYWCGAILGPYSDIFDDIDICDLVNDLGVQSNRALMLVICSCTDQLLQHLPPQFRRDREFVAMTVESNNFALQYLPFDAQQLYPDLVAMAISKFPDNLQYCEYFDHVNPELWSNLAVAEAWFSRRGPIHDKIPARLEEDSEYCLLIAEHCAHQHEAAEFISLHLRSSKDFMLRAIERNPIAYVLVHGDVAMDYDATFAGFGAANSDKLVEHITDLDISHSFPYLPHFFHEMQQKLRIHDCLFTLLCGMSSFSGDRCPLIKLIHGQETSLVWKRCIAEYMGCPIGDELTRLRTASVALQQILGWD